MDKRKNNGGARKGAGRKPKDEEQKAKRLSMQALINEFGSEQKAFNHAAERASDPDDKNAFRYFNLLIDHAYGKPKETIDMTVQEQTPIIDVE